MIFYMFPINYPLFPYNNHRSLIIKRHNQRIQTQITSGCDHELSISTTVTNFWFVLTMKYCKVRIKHKNKNTLSPVAIQSVEYHCEEKQAQQFRYGYARNSGVHRY
jgi:hypothetical protein